jgi:hypothetical protein
MTHIDHIDFQSNEIKLQILEVKRNHPLKLSVSSVRDEEGKDVLDIARLRLLRSAHEGGLEVDHGAASIHRDPRSPS